MLRATTLLAFLLGFSGLKAQITCDNEFSLAGTSATLVGDCIQLTGATTTQQGCAWLDVPIDFSQPFTHSMTMNFGTIDANGADGICLVYQPNGTSVCGIGGGGIGSEGIANSFIVEFDTWDNGAAKDDIPNDHAAVDINGDQSSAINGPYDLGNIEDGQDHTVTFTWDPSSNYYEITFDGTVILSGNFDIINNCFGGNPLGYWGYTSSTGAAFNIHTICPELAPEVVTEAGPEATLPCLGASAFLDGSLSDSGPDFIYEWTTINGNIVSGADTPFPEVDAPGTYLLTVTNLTTNCSSTDEVNVAQNVLLADITPPNYLDCYTGIVTLDGSGSSSGPNVYYGWSTTDGNILSDFGSGIDVDAPGTYTLTVMYDDGFTQCEESISVEVQEDPDVPMAFAQDAVLNCVPNFTFIDGGGSSTGGNYTYEWTTTDGQLLNGQNSLFPTVGAPGTYTLVVTNQFSGCTATAEVFVFDYTTPPDVYAEPNGVIDCSNSTVIIDGSLSSSGPDFTYAWSNSGGNILSGEGTNTITVDAAGFYTLTVTNTSTGCTSETTVQVFDGPGGVMASATALGAITCSQPSVILDGAGSSSGPDITYHWTTTEGQLSGPTNGPQATSTAAGTYTLEVTDAAGGCTATTTVTVTDDLAEPQIDAGPSAEIGCGDTSVALSGSDNTPNGNVTYSWTTADGEILSGGSTLSPSVGSPGTYVLTATNADNGCTSTDQVMVVGDDSTPTAVIVAMDTLDCGTTSMMIDGSGSDQGPNFSFAWSTSNGQFAGNPNATLTPTVTLPGAYTLEVTNLDNNCSSETTVTVLEDTTPPAATIAPADGLNCARTTITLDGTASEQGPGIAYLWSSADGSILSPTDQDSLVVNGAGTYFLTVTNGANQCTGTASLQVTIDTLAPTLTLPSPDTLDCLTGAIDLPATSSTGNATFSWTTSNGTITAGADSLTATVVSGGQYTLQVVDTTNQCLASIGTTVVQDTLRPLAQAGPDATLNCDDPELGLGGATPVAGWIYQWTTNNGQILTGGSTPAPLVNQGGTYTLLVTDVENGCTARDTVVVSENFATPMALIAPADQLTCTDTLVVLDALASSQGPDLTYLWTTSNGSILSDESSLMPTVSQAGTYQLAIVNTVSGCMVVDSVTVAQDENFPTANIGGPGRLTCDQTSLNLQGTATSQSGNVSFIWSTPNGNLVAGTNTLTPTVNEPGAYQLRVTDTDNNCQTVASVVVPQDTLSPSALAGSPDTLTCTDLFVQLDGSGSDQGAAFAFQWTTADGNINAGATTLSPLVDAAGTYELLVTNGNNGCTATDQVTISQDTLSPTLSLSGPDTLTCTTTAVLLDASASDTGAPFQFSWTTTDGAFVGGEDGSTPTVSAAGTYTVQLLNSANGCQSTASAVVLQDTLPPLASAAVMGVLNCMQTSVELSAAGSDSGPGFSLAWSTNEGNIVSGADTASPTVDAPGDYSLLITKLGNGCFAGAAVTVTQDTLAPLLTASSPMALSCANTTVALSAELQQGGADPTIIWSTTDGIIANGDSTLTPTVGAPGTYDLVVSNPGNGCSAGLSLSVQQDTISPTIMLAAPDTLTCGLTSVELDASGSDQGPGITFAWNTTDGNIAANAQGPMPTVDAPGNYQLTLLDTDNGCSRTASLTVSQDTAAPVAAILPADTLDCETSSLVVDGSASSQGVDFTYEWTSQDGTIVGPTDGDQIMASAAGTYQLLVTNTGNGCATAAEVSVTQDEAVPTVVIAEPDPLTCAVTSLVLDATQTDLQPGYTLNWTTVGGQFLGGAMGLQPEVGAPGVYTLTILNPDNGCEQSHSVTVNQDVTLPTANAGADFVLPCFAGTATLNGSGSSAGPAITYAWSTTTGVIDGDASTVNPAISGAGTYTLLVTNTENGCQAGDAVSVQEDRPVATFALSEPPCYGELGGIFVESVQGGMAPYVYALNGAPFQPSGNFGNLPAGAYEVVVQDVNGCEYVESFVVRQPDSLVLIINDPEPTILFGDSHQIYTQTTALEGTLAEIKWTHDGSLSCDTCLNPIAAPLESTNYRLMVVDSNGCSAEAFLRIFVDRRRSVYIPTAFSPNGDGVNDEFYIFAALDQVRSVREMEIFTRWGESVFFRGDFEPNDPGLGWDGEFRGQLMNSAVFVYTAEVEFIDGTVERFSGEVMLIR